MDKDLIERYKREMLKMYGDRIKPVNAVSPLQLKVEEPPTTDNQIGGIIGIITSIRSLYPVPNAKVTVFTGNMDNMQVVDTAYADESGKTKEFELQAPPKSLSLNSDNQTRPYALYNMMVEADGYLTNIHLNIPVFSGITSVQRSNMTLFETAGVNKGPQIFDELQNYNL